MLPTIQSSPLLSGSSFYSYSDHFNKCSTEYESFQQKVSCADHQVHHGACASCAAMHFFFGGEDRGRPLATPAGDAVRLCARGDGQLTAVVEPRGCPGSHSAPLPVVLGAPRAGAGAIAAHVIPSSCPEGAVVFLGGGGIPGGGAGASRQHECDPAMVYRCTDCDFKCPFGYCWQCCNHKNHNCLERKSAQIREAERAAANRKSAISDAVRKAMEEVHANLDKVSISHEVTVTEHTSTYHTDAESFVLIDSKITSDENVTDNDSCPSLAEETLVDSFSKTTEHLPGIKFPLWKKLLANSNSEDTLKQTYSSPRIRGTEKDLINEIVNVGSPDEVSKEIFNSLWMEVKDLQRNENVRLKILTWCLQIVSAFSLGTVCDFLKMLVEIDDIDSFETGVKKVDVFLEAKKKWLETIKSDTDNLCDEDRHKLFQGLSKTHWGPDLCKILKKAINNNSSILSVIDFLGENETPDATILFILTHFSSEEFSNIESWKNYVHTQILLNNSILDRKTLMKIYPSIIRLIEIGVSHTLLSKLLNSKALEIQNSTKEFIQSLGILIDYNIGAETIETTLRDNWCENIINWPESIDRSVTRMIFKKPILNQLSDLIKKLRSSNEHIPEDLEKMCSSVFEKFNQRVNIQTQDEKLRNLGMYKETIKSWSRKDVVHWAQLIQKKFIPECLEETLAVLMQAVKLHTGFVVRKVQILAVLILLHPRDNTGTLAQINTGEGKSLVVAMLAAVHALRGKTVDVVTTSADLAKREAKDKRTFFEMLNLTVSENTSCDKDIEVDVYKSHVVYGTAVNFIGDVLRKEFLGSSGRGERLFDLIILDEVDSLLFDDRASSVRLAQTIPGMMYLEAILAAIWERAHRLAASIIMAHNGKTYFADDPEEAEWLMKNASDDHKNREVGDRRDYIVTKTQEHAEQLIRKLEDEEKSEYEEYLAVEREIYEREIKGKDDNSKEEGDYNESQKNKLKEKLKMLPWITKERYAVVQIPEHTRKFAKSQILYWVRNAVSAMEDYHKDAHYTVKKDRIVPISYDENGELQMDLVWSDGTTQFLQIKEGLPLSAETLSTNYLSNVGFFLRYGSNIYGVTGTLGGTSTHKFLTKVYKVHLVIIPPYMNGQIQENEQSPYLCKELRPLILRTYEDWFQTVVTHVIYHASMGRAVLVICRFVKQVKKFARVLRKRYTQNKVKKYTGEEVFDEYSLNCGDIVVATNIAGRGTDFRLTPYVLRRGGLYVAVTFLPGSLRVDSQNMGRAARNGAPGLGQFILQAPSPHDLASLRQQRDTLEAEASDRALRDVDHVLMQDSLFAAFCNLENSLLPSQTECDMENQWPKLKRAWDAYAKSHHMTFKEQMEKLKKDFQKKMRIKLRRIPSRNDSETVTSAEEVDIDQEYENVRPSIDNALRMKLLHDFCSNQRNKFPPQLINCLLAGKEYSFTKSDLCEANGWGVYERQGLEERWALWLRGNHFEAQHDTASALRQFENFEASVQEDAEKNKLIENPFYYVRKGNDIYAEAVSLPLISVFARNDLLKKAIECYDKAIELDNVFSGHARYNKACALLTHQWNWGEKQKNAHSELEKAKELIDHTYKPSIVAVHSLLATTGAKVGTVQHIQHQLNILDQEKHNIEKAIDVLKTAEKSKNHVVVCTTPLEKVMRDCGEDHSLAIREQMANGLVHFFFISEMPPIAWGSVIGLTVIALAQIAVGAIMIITGGSPLGMALVTEGIGDLVTAVTSVFHGGVAWGKWAVAKACSLAMSVISGGWKAVKGGFGAIKSLVGYVKEAPLHAVWVGGRAVAQAVTELSQTIQYTDIENGLRQQMERCESAEEMLGLAFKGIMEKMVSSNKFFKDVTYIDRNEEDCRWQEILVSEAMKLYEKGKYFLKSEELQVQLLRHIERVRDGTSDAEVLPADLIEKVTSFAEDFVKDFSSKVASKYITDVLREKKRLARDAESAQTNRDFRAESFAAGPSASGASQGFATPGADADDAGNASGLTNRLAGAVCQRFWRNARVKMFVERRPPRPENATSTVMKESENVLKKLLESMTQNKGQAAATSVENHDAPPGPSQDWNRPQLNSCAKKALMHLASSAQLDTATVHFMAKAMGRVVFLLEDYSGKIIHRTEVRSSEKPIMLLVDKRGCTPLTVYDFTRSERDHDLLRAAIAEAGSSLQESLREEESLRTAIEREILKNPGEANELFTSGDGEPTHNGQSEDIQD